ncbi:MAG: hypothetical protein AMJ73_01695 [candidate division Zixibacteria bacterium SM1_73]|nr:MAG: hypothetical protein AMJ73_01695 [candidate division Zixibacteria bacterium SM1_73]
MIRKQFFSFVQKRYYKVCICILLLFTMVALLWNVCLVSKTSALSKGSSLVEFTDSYIEPFFPEGIYHPDIPTPESVMGFPMGSKPCHYEEVVSYLKLLAESTPRAELREYGKTHEGRTLYYLIISSEEKMKKLEQIRSSMARLADPRTFRQEEEAFSLMEKTPAIVWLAYCVHGDEISPTDAAVQIAYQLIAGTDSLTEKIRNQVVTIVDPLQNPDGRERFLKQMEMWSGVVPNFDDQSLQHGGFWPWGRGNHYLFDLNRDWFALVHPETRGKVKAVLQWNPQVLVDAHEMGPLDTYLFSPPREPFHPSVSKTLKKWWKVFARDQAQAFDEYGWSYYTREWMEMWYPGYANSWILYTGGLGILYEQAGVQGSSVRQKDGTILSYRESVHHHFVSSMANLRTAAENRKELLQDFYKEKKRAIQGEKNNSIQTFLFVLGKNKSRADKLVETLMLQGIEIEKAKDDFTVGKVHDFWGRSFSSKRFPQGTYVVHLDQPLRPLIQAILEFDPRMSESFLEEERHELEKRKQTRLYEVNAWSVPMAYNVETYWTENKVRTRTEKVLEMNQSEGKVENPTEGGIEDPAEGGGVNPHPKYGYLLDYSDDKAVNALTSLLSAECGSFRQVGLKVRIAERAFKVEGTQFSRGSILLKVSENSEKLHDFVNEIAQELAVTFHGVNTALSEEGPDLGGHHFRLLELPRIGLFAGPSLDFTSYGSIWHLLDQRLGMQFSSLNINALNWVDLDKYNLLILPAVWGAPEAYTHILGKHGIERLRKWIESGGTFIAIGTGAAFAADTTVKLSQVRLRRQVLDKLSEYEEAVRLEEQAEKPQVESSMVWNYTQDKEKKPEESKKAEGKQKQSKRPEELKREDERLRIFMPRGVILRADLDQEHWLTSGMSQGSAYGGDDKVPVILYTDFAFMSKSPVQTVARLSCADSLRLSGLLWPEARERWAKTAYLTRESLGKGQIILFAFQPDFRGYFFGSERLLVNALLFGPGLGTTRPAPW